MCMCAGGPATDIVHPTAAAATTAPMPMPVPRAEEEAARPQEPAAVPTAVNSKQHIVPWEQYHTASAERCSPMAASHNS